MDENQRVFFLKQLNHQEVEKRRQAILNLSTFDDPGVYKVLSSHFSDGHPTIRSTLSQVFLVNSNRRKAEIVSDALQSPQISAKSLAMEILKNMGSEAVMPLRRLSKSNDPDMRKTAVELLGDIKDESCSQILLESLEDPVQSVRISVIDGLGKHREIRAVPKLLEYYEKSDEEKAPILKALTKIFLYWEKSIMQPDVFEADPVMASTFINSIQEHGNNSALGLVIHWLERDNSENGDELLKAIAAILEKNHFTTLPSYLYSVIKDTWNLFQNELPRSVFLNCLSRIPSSDSLGLLLKYFVENPNDPDVEKAITTHLKLFFPIFLSLFNETEKNIRINILELLIRNKVKIHDSGLLKFYKQARRSREKIAFLRLAAISKLPEAKNMLLAKLSSQNRKQSEMVLESLLNFRDENLWILYQKYIHHANPKIQQIAKEGLAQYPHKTIEFILSNSDHMEQEQHFQYLDVIFLLSQEKASEFFNSWLKTSGKDREVILEKYLKFNGNSNRVLNLARVGKHNFSISAKLFHSMSNKIRLQNVFKPDEKVFQNLPH